MKQLIWILLLLTQYSWAQDFDSSHLPIMIIDTQGEEIPDEPKINVLMGLIDNGLGQINELTDPYNDYDGIIGIERRGSTSQTIFPKIGYGFETRQADGSNNNVSLLGLPEENDWILHGPYSDKTLIRNVLTYHMAGQIMPWAPRTRFIELVINEEYMGVYILMEKIKRDANRVDIATLNPEDISGDQLTGGYLIKLDKFTGDNNDGWMSLIKPIPDQDQFIFFQYHEPQADEINQVQKGYIQSFMDEFEFNLQSSDFADPENGYAQYIDPESFIDFLLINELTRNVDGYRLSTYLYKDRDSVDTRLKMGPVWDFNIALGNANYCEGGSTEGFAYNFNEVCSEDFFLIPFWWNRLLEDQAFACALYNRWFELREDLFSTDQVMNTIDSMTTVLGDAADRNFERWPVIGEPVWPNNYIGESYQEEVNYLKDWLTDRMNYLDFAFTELCLTSSLIPIPNAPAVRVAPNISNGDPFGFYFSSFQPTEARLVIYDAMGKLVYDNTEAFPSAGDHRMQWHPQVGAGTYFYQVYRGGIPLQSGKVIKF